AGAACSSNGSPPATDDSPRDSATAAPTRSGSTQSGDELSTEDLVKLAEPSVVRIATGSGVGSGFVIDPDGYIMTNNHVVAGARSVTVTLSDGSEHEASVVGTDPRADLALIKIEQTGLAALAVADLDDVDIGQDVVAIGYALDLTGGEGAAFSVTRGIVSQKNRAISEGDTGILGSIQTDAAINHGNSGGPLLNLFGEVVGINTALQPDTSTGGIAQGIGYAVGSDTVEAVYEQLRADGRVNRGLLGVRAFEALRPAQAREMGLPEGTRGIWLSDEGVRTAQGIDSSVDPGGPADRAGIEPGDVIVKLGDVDIRNEGDLAIAMIKNGPGETVDVELYRDGEKMTIDVTIGTPA
ncbi:MAG: trypsin-like peptidase domain-containing protein, partial [Dehalococcoidia bacterium]